MEGRTRFVDEEVLDAVAQGISQIVVVGAGYDGRSLRFRKPGIRFFEVDHPATQVDKRRRLEAVGAAVDNVTFVPTDLGQESIAAVLAAAGHACELPSLFICEGLLLYLAEDAVERLLTDVRTRAASGSRLVISTAELGHKPQMRDRIRQAMLAAIGEPHRSQFRPGSVGRLLAETGWEVVREVSQPRGSGRLVRIAAKST